MISNLRFSSLYKKQVSLWLILFVALSGCQAPIITVEQISERKVGQKVYLTGQIVRQAPFLDNAAYQLEDKTGKVWVVTKNLPQSQQQVNIKGEIRYQSLPFAEQELGDFYIVEIEQLSSLPE